MVTPCWPSQCAAELLDGYSRLDKNGSRSVSELARRLTRSLTSPSRPAGSEGEGLQIVLTLALAGERHETGWS